MSTMQVLSCYSCGERHDEVELQKFSKDDPIWTHWYSCPKSGDPVPMKFSTKDGAPPVEQVRKALADLDRAIASGKWLSAIFFMSGKDRVTIQWISENFPHAEYATCERLFASESAKHGGLPAPLEPLPRAAGYQPSQEFDLSKVLPGLMPQPIPAGSFRDRIDEALGGQPE